MNHQRLASPAQLKTRMFGYRAHARSSVWSHLRMLASAYGPEDSSEMTLTHMTGSPWAADIIRWILVIRPTLEPTATSAVSLVPSASTQQPRNPWWRSWSAAV